MALIDLTLSLVALLLWLNWRAVYFDPLVRTTPTALVGTLRRAEPRRLRGAQLFAGLLALLFLRGLLYWEIGSPSEWTPKLVLGPVILAFRSENFWCVALFSLLSFFKILVLFHFWLLIIAAINYRVTEPDPILKIIRLHLGKIVRWPWPILLLLPILYIAAIWMLLHPLLLKAGVVDPARSWTILVEQGLLLGICPFVTLKFLLPPILLLHLITTYVFLGSNAGWDFISGTANRLLSPLRLLPLRIARLDIAPLVGMALLLLLLHWLPNFLQLKLSQSHRLLWPQ
jgi:hypothetical protein